MGALQIMLSQDNPDLSRSVIVFLPATYSTTPNVAYPELLIRLLLHVHGKFLLLLKVPFRLQSFF